MSSRIATVARLRRPHAVPREGVLVGVLVIEVIALAQLSPYFLNIDDLLGAAQFFVETGLMALGMTLVIIVGGIDLSVGGSLALASVTLGFSYSAGAPLWFSILAAIGVSTAGGFLNGYLTTRWAIHPLAITLATGELFRGIAAAITNEGAVSTFPSWFNRIGQSQIGPMPAQLIVLVVAATALWLALSRGRFGRHVYAIGINEEAARFSGIPVKRIKMLLYGITGFLVGIAAVIYTSRVSTARSDADIGIELSVIAAVFLGGASFYGGAGTVLGTMLGVVIIALLQQGLLLVPNLDSNWTQVAIGAVMVAGVFANEFFRRGER
jgi:ribose/xylose/arabinose/galactoside ABC-type transport system permease subunit